MRWISFISVLLISTTGITAQTLADLTIEEKLEYNRRKIAVEAEGRRSGIFGWKSIAGFTSADKEGTDQHRWTAYTGTGDVISESEFYRLTGYPDEADRAEKREGSISHAMSFGSTASFFGMVLMYTPGTGSIDKIHPGEEEVAAYPLLIPCALTSLAGSASWIWGHRQQQIHLSPIAIVRQIAADYNKYLVAQIIESR